MHALDLTLGMEHAIQALSVPTKVAQALGHVLMALASAAHLS